MTFLFGHKLMKVTCKLLGLVIDLYRQIYISFITQRCTVMIHWFETL